MKIHILIIEDNASDAKLVNHYLSKEKVSCTCHIATSMKEGERISREKSIDLVLLDLCLPDSTKIQTLNTFVKIFPKLPVVIMTSAKDEAFVDRALMSGAQDYLVKGKFESTLLKRVIQYSLKRHRDQLELREAKERLVLAEVRSIEAEKMANFGRWEIDIVSNEMTWTDQVYIIFGFKINTISPSLSSYLEYIHPDDRKMVFNSFQESMKDGQLRKIEYRIIIDGTKLRYLANQFQISITDFSEQTLLVGAVQDVTERKLNEELLADKNLIEKTSKIKEDLLEDLSFQIRTPLSSIFNFSYLLEGDLKDGPQHENLVSLKSSVNDLSIAINNMLNFSILVSEKIKVEEKQFKLEELITNLRRIVQVKADNKNIKLDFLVQSKNNAPYIGDQNKINQILYNLLDNAIQQTPENGCVNLSIEEGDADDAITDLKFIVADNGVGLLPEKIEELLSPKALIEGGDSMNGLGIPIAKRLAERMKGSVNIFSKIKEGSQFVLELPLRKVAVTRQQIGTEPLHEVNMLFVEDHFLNQISTSSILKKWSDKISVEIADNGKIGVDKFLAGDYNLVLMDLQMPVMNGFEAAIKIRESSNVPIIALSANTNKAEAEKCKEAGMNEYLAKPFMPEDLYECIMKVLYFS